MCVIVQSYYFPHVFLIACMTAGLRVNVLKDNTEIDIKEIVLMSTRNELNLINTQP